MAKTAAVIGATGQIGRAAVQRLARDGMSVTAISRTDREDVDHATNPAIHTVHLDRNEPGALAAGLAAALPDGCDVLVDTVAFGADHASQLLDLADLIGSAVVISSASVYVDAAGHGFDTQQQHFPEYPTPIGEQQPTVTPGDTTYSTRKVALEQTLLDAATFPVTLLRAAAIHGPGSRMPREWYFVKRALDGRTQRLLPYLGESRFHPIATANLAELISCAARHPGAGPVNAGDPDAPTVSQIAAAIDLALDRHGTDIPVPGMPANDIGATPWSVPSPIVLDMTKAADQLGYTPAGDYAHTVRAAVRDMVDRAAGRDWRQAFPNAELALGPNAFDYAAEDHLIADT